MLLDYLSKDTGNIHRLSAFQQLRRIDGLTQAASGAIQYLLPEYQLVHNCLLFSYYPSSTKREITALLAEKLAGLLFLLP